VSHHERNHAQAKHINDLWLYLQGVEELKKLEDLAFVFTVARQHHHRLNWTARGIELGRLLRHSRSTITRILKRIAGRNGWVKRDRRWGRKSNVYTPTWRLLKIMAQVKKGGF